MHLPKFTNVNIVNKSQFWEKVLLSKIKYLIAREKFKLRPLLIVGPNNKRCVDKIG
ncbi:hypothetical protein MADA3029_670029 [Vibrio nigripulchritudo MADA3029]|nr:hypothetical protein VIBNIMADA3020_610029 [Vibrio nigripulchritudo MADA3020]CCN54057.1 hypothetical protein VIBNIMADA3021_500029 [Vibrio nigripulchritudo MADA3021]CCN60919.1 hypothetical protein MADA3029_670029 [Vibrio nigripulchritudo MADA3029]